MRVARTLAIVLCGSASALPARAAERVPYRVDYRGAASCPGVDHFTRQLSARSRRLVPAPGADPALTFVVEITESAQAVEGRLLLIEPNGTVTERIVPGSNCTEVLDALALVAAVSVDPGATLEPAAEPEPEPAPVRPEPPPSAPPPARAPEPAAPKRTSGGWGAGTAVSVESNLAPDPVPAFGIYAELLGQQQGPWTPYARAGLHRAQSATIEVPAGAPEGLRSGHAQLTWFSGRLIACPVALGVRTVTARPCASFDLGVLRGNGYFTADQRPAAESTVWMAAGASIEVELVVAEHLRLGLDGGLSNALRRGQFFLAPRYFGQSRLRVHEIGALAWHGGALVGIRFF